MQQCGYDHGKSQTILKPKTLKRHSWTYFDLFHIIKGQTHSVTPVAALSDNNISIAELFSALSASIHVNTHK